MKEAGAALIVILFAGIGTSAVGEVYEFELPEVAGMEANTTVTTEFVYHGPSGDVVSLAARVFGTVDYLGLIECFETPPDTSDWVLDLGTLTRRKGDMGYWYGSPEFLAQLGTFDKTYNHHTYNGGFSTVTDGDTIEVDVYFLPAALIGICHPITGPSTGRLLGASILIDVMAPTPVEGSTWGRTKGRYRSHH